jgi:hypothetical protein
MHEGDLASYIKAQSPMGLRSLMLRNNARYGFTFHYFDIQFVKGFWYAWFYVPSVKLMIDEVKNGTEEKV